MDATTLKTIRESWGYTPPEMAVMLRTKYSTYRDWESGKSKIPGHMALLLSLLKERDEKITRSILDGIEARITRDFPRGIKSAPIETEA